LIDCSSPAAAVKARGVALAARFPADFFPPRWNSPRPDAVRPPRSRGLLVLPALPLLRARIDLAVRVPARRARRRRPRRFRLRAFERAFVTIYSSLALPGSLPPRSPPLSAASTAPAPR